jgi:UDP-N-acetylmuramyl pentapeptide phosphotransferase/UDP-N-acetylglucosamine-1-phosphate transferase
VLVYALASALPFLTFPPLARRLRARCPHGFVLTEFVRERFGLLACLFLSVCSCLTMCVLRRLLSRRAVMLTRGRFIYMVSELTSISGAINSLTGLDGLPATIVEVVVTVLVRFLHSKGNRS